MIGIRVDGNSSIGTGHLSRCLSIAAAIKKKGTEILFICSGDTQTGIIEEAGFPVKTINGSTYDKWCIAEETECIRSLNITTLFIDSYYVRQEHMRLLHRNTKIVYLDDLNMYDYDADAVINYNIEANEGMYSCTENNERKIYTGVRYFPLKESLSSGGGKDIRAAAEKVLLSTGGTDPFACTDKILSALAADYKNIVFYVILGLFFDEKYKTYMSEKYSQFSNIVFLKWGQDMKKLYLDSDIFIAPGSTTVYEALSVGTPCISFKFAENHEGECISLDKLGITPYAGDFSEACDDEKLKMIFSEELQYSRRKERSNRFRRLFDGEGAGRIADIVIGINNENKV